MWILCRLNFHLSQQLIQIEFLTKENLIFECFSMKLVSASLQTKTQLSFLQVISAPLCMRNGYSGRCLRRSTKGQQESEKKKKVTPKWGNFPTTDPLQAGVTSNLCPRRLSRPNLGPLTPTLAEKQNLPKWQSISKPNMENNSSQKPRISKGGRKSRGPSRIGAQGICWCWHLPALHLQAKAADPVECVAAWLCVYVRGAGEKGGYVLACAMSIDPTWPPYVAETRRMAGNKVTPPDFTCVPALNTSCYQTLHHSGARCRRDPSVGLLEH